MSLHPHLAHTSLARMSACMHAPRPAGISAPFHEPEKIVHVIDLKTQDEEDSACTREGPRTKM